MSGITQVYLHYNPGASGREKGFWRRYGRENVNQNYKIRLAV